MADPKTLVVRQPTNPIFLPLCAFVAIAIGVLAVVGRHPTFTSGDDSGLGKVFGVLAGLLVAVLWPPPRAELSLAGGKLTVTRVTWPVRRRWELRLHDVRDVGVGTHRTWNRLVLVRSSGEQLVLLSSRWRKAIEREAANIRGFLGRGDPPAV